MRHAMKKVRVSVAEPLSAVVRTGSYPAESGVRQSGIECKLCHAACDAIGGGPLCHAACDATVC